MAPGAMVGEVKLANGNTIPAITVGEEGRGRKLGVLPVGGAQKGDKIFFGRIGKSTSGRAKLVTGFDDDDEGSAILVMHTPMGYRGGNTHTGDREPEFMAMEANPDGIRIGYLPWPGQDVVSGAIAQGTAGNMGSGSQVVTVMPAGVVFRTNYQGRMYGAPAAHYYRFDGTTVTAVTWDERIAADLWFEAEAATAPESEFPAPPTIAGVLSLAAKLPSGLNDPLSAEKLLAEKKELEEDLAYGDRTGALTEAADAVYYACKHLDWVANQVGLSVDDLFELAVAKYSLRARPGNPKNDEAERAAVEVAL